MTASGEICLYLGGFETDQRSSMLEQRLISLDIQAGQAVTNLESSKDYWVYLPPFGSRDAALRQFKELQALTEKVVNEATKPVTEQVKKTFDGLKEVA